MKRQCRTRGFIQALLLALLLNLSGHTFLHLADSALDAGETHFTSHEEPRNNSAPQHQCSVCQDHQQLTLDFPATTASFVAAPTWLATQHDELILVAPIRTNSADRAPPRS